LPGILYYRGTGRRKTAVARVRLKPGRGSIDINGRSLNDFFTEEKDRRAVLHPLEVTETTNKVDVMAKVTGGGYTGQAGAVVLGIARALVKLDPDVEGVLRSHQLLTRDGRQKERKKYGRRGARRSVQFSVVRGTAARSFCRQPRKPPPGRWPRCRGMGFQPMPRALLKVVGNARACG